MTGRTAEHSSQAMHAPLYRSCLHSGHVTDPRQEQWTIDWCKAVPDTPRAFLREPAFLLISQRPALRQAHSFPGDLTWQPSTGPKATMASAAPTAPTRSMA